MEFEEEIQDKEYFEEKIKSLEERITKLENRALVYGGWPENNNPNEFNLDSLAQGIRNALRKIENDK